jgi:hypothetical protein
MSSFHLFIGCLSRALFAPVELLMERAIRVRSLSRSPQIFLDAE